MSNSEPPTLIEWIGGPQRVEELIGRFYEKVVEDPLVGPLFSHMDAQHSRYVAMFISEVFGGPKAYSETRGGHPHMIRKHLGKSISKHSGSAGWHSCCRLPTTLDCQTTPNSDLPS